MNDAEVTFIHSSPELCIATLEECIHMGLPAAWIYNLHVGERLLTTARGLVRTILDGTNLNPFVPQINVVLEPGYRGCQWYIEAGGVAFGSRAW